MSIYLRDEIAPEWEPDPWNLEAAAADAQEIEFHRRAGMPIEWRPVHRDGFPAEGIFGYQRDWFSSADVTFVASTDDEDFLLIDHVWFGWPDPPRWGLASRPSGRADLEWTRWGNFANLPSRWVF